MRNGFPFFSITYHTKDSERINKKKEEKEMTEKRYSPHPFISIHIVDAIEKTKLLNFVLFFSSTFCVFFFNVSEKQKKRAWTKKYESLKVPACWNDKRKLYFSSQMFLIIYIRENVGSSGKKDAF